MWPFSPRNSSQTGSGSQSGALSDPQQLELRLGGVEVRVEELRSQTSDLERQGRLDKLELLDIHERVKKSLAKLNRRRQELQKDDPDDPDQLPLLDQPQPRPVAQLMSRRGR